MSTEARVQELLEDNNRLLEEGRSARRAAAKAQWEADCARSVAFEMLMAMRRLDPVFGGT